MSQQSTNGRDIFFILAIRFPKLVKQHGTVLSEWLAVEDRRYGEFDRYDIDRLAVLTQLSTTDTRLELLKAEERVCRYSPKP